MISPGQPNHEVRITLPEDQLDRLMGLIGDFALHSDIAVSVREEQAPLPEVKIATHRIDEHFVGVPFNPQVVSFLSLGRDRANNPLPAIPVLVKHKMATVVNEQMGRDEAYQLANGAAYTMADLIRTHSDPLKFLTAGLNLFIKADTLGELVALAKPIVERKKARLDQNANASVHDEKYNEFARLARMLRRYEATLDLLSACNKRVMLPQ